LKKIAVAVSIYKNTTLSQLKQMFESLYTQTQKADIFIKVDGGISIKIKEYLQELYNSNKIEYLDFREQNKGIAVSYNELFKVVIEENYEYIARMDADDIAFLNRIKLQFEFMEANQDIDVVGGYIEEFGDNFSYDKVVQYPLKHELMFQQFAMRVPIANVTTFFRRTFFEKAGYYPISSPTNEDTLMWMKGFLNGCRFANISEILVKVRVSKSFLGRRSGMKKAWSDFKDRVKVIQTLGYNVDSYFYAFALFLVNISPASIKKFLYMRLR
jgi:hypothetical protein